MLDLILCYILYLKISFHLKSTFISEFCCSFSCMFVCFRRNWTDVEPETSCCAVGCLYSARREGSFGRVLPPCISAVWSSGQRLTTLRTASVPTYLHAAPTMQKCKRRYQNSHSSVWKQWPSSWHTFHSYPPTLLMSTKPAVPFHFMFRLEMKAMK